MNGGFLKVFFFCLVFIGAISILSAQNLVPNYSFETISFCPETFGGPGLSAAPPWAAPTLGTPDIFNSCSSSGQVDVPNNFFGNQVPITGEGYSGGYCKLINFEYREYLTAPLDEPLTAGAFYYVSFYVSPGETFGCAIEQIGAYFSASPPNSSQNTAINVTPQVESDQGFLDDFVNWILIEGCFQAQGGEAYITIGNFHNDADTPLNPGCSSGNAYYYYEDISVVEGMEPGSIDLDLGGPEEACFSYEIDPGLSGYNFIWEDGSNGPTLVVTESGVYSLTISDGCNYGVDSIEVTINGSYGPIDLGADTLLCLNDEYTLMLDPDLSEYTWQDGSNGPSFTITTAGTYAVTLDDGCSVYTDEIEVEYLDPPAPFDLGEDANLCFGDEIEYNFDPSLGDFMWQDNSTSPEYTIFTGGMFALTISNICGMESDEIIITDLDIPEVQIGPDEQTICNGEILEIEIDPALGDILWQDGSNLPNYEISTPGLYIVFVTNECGTGSDQVEVTVVEPPSIEFGPDVFLCAGETILLSANGVEGTYLWQDGSTEETFLVTEPGWYSLEIENFCGTVYDDIFIEYTFAIVPPDLGPDVSLCPGEQLVLYANNPGAEYLWQDFSTADTLLVTTSGTYSVQVFNDCNLLTDTVVVTINDSAPQVDLPSQVSLCQGETTTLDAGIAGVDYLWSDGSTNAQLLVSSPGLYSITVSSTCGTDRDTVTVLDGGPTPTVTLGNDIGICLGDMVLINPVFSNVDSWLWQDGSTLPEYTASAAGEISVQVMNACGSAFDTLQVAFLPATPPIDLGPDTAVCSGQSVVLTINTPDVDILWSDGSDDPSFTLTNPGVFFANITNSCGTNADTILFSFLPDVPPLDLGPDQSLCPGEIITIAPGIPNVTYLWQDGSTGVTYDATQQESVILSITNQCGTSTDTLEIFESTQGPQIDLGDDIQVCAGETVTIPSGISGVTYLWQDGSNTPDYSTTVSGTFILNVSNNCGTDADTILVDISGFPPDPVLGPDTTLCEGVSITLFSLADDETSITWQDGSSSPTFTVSSPGTYTLAESNRCGDAADTIIITYLDAPDPFFLGPDTTLCPGASITLTAPSASYDILWQDGSDQLSIVADQPLTYSLMLSNDCGSVMDQLVVDFDTRVPVLNIDSSLAWCEGDLFTLDATQSFVADYLWSTGATASSIVVSSPGAYSVEVISLCNTLSQQIDVYPGTDCITPDVHIGMAIPNVFSPNGDGINELFGVSFGSDLQVDAMKGSIFDRWGNLVYSSEAIPFLWNGFFKDERVMPGVYAYVIQVEYTYDGIARQQVFYGDVTVVR